MKIDWKALPSLSSLRAFELTARIGNFASAARELNVTHAAIAQRVRSLETHLGIVLARRSGRSVVLTDAGARLASHLTEGFGTIATGIEKLKADQSEQPVKIAATVFISQVVVLPRLHEFWRIHPDIQVSVMPSQDVVDIVALGIDLAIRASVTEPDWPGLKAEPLLESEVIVVGAPSMVNEGMPSLDQLPWIWSRGIEYEEKTVQAFGLDTDKLKNVDLGSPILQLSSARQGMGITFAPEIVVHDDLASGDLCRVPVPSPFSLTYYAVTPIGPVRPQAAAVITWLKESLTKQRQTSA